MDDYWRLCALAALDTSTEIVPTAGKSGVLREAPDIHVRER